MSDRSDPETLRARSGQEVRWARSGQVHRPGSSRRIDRARAAAGAGRRGGGRQTAAGSETPGGTGAAVPHHVTQELQGQGLSLRHMKTVQPFTFIPRAQGPAVSAADPASGKFRIPGRTILRARAVTGRRRADPAEASPGSAIPHSTATAPAAGPGNTFAPLRHVGTGRPGQGPSVVSCVLCVVSGALCGSWPSHLQPDVANR